MGFIRRIVTGIIILGIIICSFTETECQAAYKSPKLNVKTLNLAKNASYKLRMYNLQEGCEVNYESDDDSVVAVSGIKGASCRLKALALGTATVTADVSDAEGEIIASLECVVTVAPPAASIKFNKKHYKLTEGKSKRIKAVIKPNTSNEKAMYVSDNPDIAMVSSNGTVLAVSPGQTTIRAIISNGKESSYQLTVISAANRKDDKDDPAVPASKDKNNDSNRDTDKDKGTDKEAEEPGTPLSKLALNNN